MLVLCAAAVALIGFSRGRFHVTSDRSDDTPGVTLTVDRDKVRDDKDKVVGAAQGSTRSGAQDKGAAGTP